MQICILKPAPKRRPSCKVSVRAIASAAKVLKEGSPELVAAVERGEVKVSAAEKQIKTATAEKADRYVADQDKRLAQGKHAIRCASTFPLKNGSR